MNLPPVKMNGAHTESLSIGPGLINIYNTSSAVTYSIAFVWNLAIQADVVEVHRT